MPDSQERAHRHHEHAEEVDESTVDTPPVNADKESLDAEVDAILDEIDEVLETNAEEFVRQFVQKGGQ